MWVFDQKPMQITPVLLIEWKLRAPPLCWPIAGVKLAFEPNAQILKMYVGKLAFVGKVDIVAMVRWRCRRPGDAP